LGIGSKRARQALDRLVDAALIVEDIGEVVLCLSGWVTFCSFHYIISNLE
jgi:hypothetical protein